MKAPIPRKAVAVFAAVTVVPVAGLLVLLGWAVNRAAAALDAGHEQLEADVLAELESWTFPRVLRP